MLKMINVLWKLIQKFLGLTQPEHVWKWIGEEGSPRWSMSYWFDGFNFQALLIPSQDRPKDLGLFLNCPCAGSIHLGNGVHYLPALMTQQRLHDLLLIGMSQANAERAVRREIRAEMALTDQYDSGAWQAHQLIVMIKRGRTVLATKVVDGLKVDLESLLLGGEVHVTDRALSLRTSLRDMALQELKAKSRAVIHSP